MIYHAFELKPLPEDQLKGGPRKPGYCSGTEEKKEKKRKKKVASLISDGGRQTDLSAARS